ncbi:MAG: hypothetical protein KBG30_01545 [Bacteroidales bacterium]|jgi:hypothetical protein|nr:hypothetical protein [Bacteroidales bacterium]
MKISDDLRKLVELQLKTLTQLEDCEKKFNLLGLKVDKIDYPDCMFDIARVTLNETLSNEDKGMITECFNGFDISFITENVFVIEYKQ